MKKLNRKIGSVLGFGIAALMAIAPTSYSKEGGSSGGGADGLYLNSQRSDSTIVPVPDVLTAYGYLMIKGVPGSGQRNEFSYLWCPMTADGKLDKTAGQCKWDSAFLNQPIRIRPGLIYEIEYAKTELSHSVKFPVKLARDARLTYELKKLEVPKVDSTFNYSVYVDFSDVNNKEQLMENFDRYYFQFPRQYESSNQKEVNETFKEAKLLTPSLKLIKASGQSGYDKEGVRTLLQAIASGDIAADAQLVARAKLVLDYSANPSADAYKTLVGPNGGSLGFEYATCETRETQADSKHFQVYRCKLGESLNKPDPSTGERFVWVDDPKDGDFVSVFPGTYGIKFTSEDGQVSFVHGIQVK